MNRKILEVTFNGFDADAKGIGYLLSGYVPIILHHFHYPGVDVFGLKFRFVGSRRYEQWHFQQSTIPGQSAGGDKSAAQVVF